MKSYNKIIVGGLVASALSLAPIAFAANTTPAQTKKPIVAPVKKVNPKVEAARKNKVVPTNPSIVKKMQATEKAKKAAAEARMRAELNNLKAKAQAQTKKVQ